MSTKKNPYLQDRHVADPTLARRRKPQLKFARAGKFVEQAEQMRTEHEMAMLREEIGRTARKAGLSDLASVAEIGVGELGAVPQVEWWDAQFLRSYYVEEAAVDTSNINALIQHPVPVELPTGTSLSSGAQVMLTAREKKRARKLRRMEALKDKNLKIALDLLPREEPKLKMSNVMRVMGNEAVLDPTAVEKLVQTQMRERVETHLKQNEERKLTPAERSLKNHLKHAEDISRHVHVAAYCINDLSNPSHRFKVTKNAEQLQLTGMAILYDDVNIVVVEGGPKGIAKYKKLMLHRIKWAQYDDINNTADGGDEAHDENTTSCQLIWEGAVVEKKFATWPKLKPCTTAEGVRALLGVEYGHFLDLALRARSGA